MEDEIGGFLVDLNKKDKNASEGVSPSEIAETQPMMDSAAEAEEQGQKAEVEQTIPTDTPYVSTLRFCMYIT